MQQNLYSSDMHTQHLHQDLYVFKLTYASLAWSRR